MMARGPTVNTSSNHPGTRLRLARISTPPVEPIHCTIMIAVVWHFWIAPILAAGSILAVVAVIIGYVTNVTAKQYPRGRQKQQ